MPRIILILLWFAITLRLISSPATAQESTTPIVLGEQFSLRSDILHEERLVQVYKPAGYEHSTAVYPVLYLLDGDGHLLHTAGITQFLSQNGKMPPVLIVAIPNTDRTRDLTPALRISDQRFPTAGGADAFLSFIEEELMPRINAAYRVAPYRILVGHSFGGLLSVHTLLSRPELFDAHIAISPSLWWDNKGLLDQAELFFEDHSELTNFMYMTMGNEGGAMLSGARGMAGIFEEKGPDTFEWHFELMEEETHGSIPHRSTYKGLEVLYADWNLERPGEVFDKKGLAGLDEHFAYLSNKYGYEIRTPEAMVNQMGYRLIGQGKPSEAIKVFQRNVDDFPESANVYDSLGDAYDANEQFDLARESYEKACSLGRASNNPNTALYCGNLNRLNEKLSTQ